MILSVRCRRTVQCAPRQAMGFHWPAAREPKGLHLPVVSPSQGFHSPAASESLSLGWPRESNQREGHPDTAVSGLLPCDCATRLRGFADSPSLD